ncbi:ribosomal protein S18-alanine N-acetyltransferase [Tindallia californiensis]|uniref:[SSU ribosomal protein S18P]-alanine acetyltransferase n=1 Tax=Tindallia californiensis TaxID=159292 RepID=A0A1H3L897_9FIRM|nr:ribosomal protein S18-alanine N-acetyltransferase [Tindallia californiensis]SDY60419.1 [SSU ribosomal protein S18P]-alanine acetyltransferase [Tindallia californiensis]
MNSHEIVVRQLEIEDIPGIIEIEKACFPTPWTHHAFRAEMRNKLAVYQVVETEGKIAAYGGMWLIMEEAHITNVAVHPSFRRRGLGRKVMEALVAEAKKKFSQRMTLEVRKSNTIALELYKSMDFVISGIRPGYYHDNGEDAIIMWKELTIADFLL